MEGAWGGVWLLIRSADWRPWAGSGGVLGVAGVSRNAMPTPGRVLNTRKSKQLTAATFGYSFRSELQQESIMRWNCDSQKWDIALSTISLRTFGARSGVSPPSKASESAPRRQPKTIGAPIQMSVRLSSSSSSTSTNQTLAMCYHLKGEWIDIPTLSVAPQRRVVPPV